MADVEEKAPSQTSNALSNPHGGELASGGPEQSLRRLGLEKKKEIFDLAERDSQVKLTFTMKMLLVVLAFAVVAFTSYTYYSFQQTRAHDETLEEKVMAGDTIETLNALKRQNAQNINTIYILFFGSIILLLMTAFGYLLYTKNTDIEHVWKTMRMVRKATEVVDLQGVELSDEQDAQKAVVKKLEEDVAGYEKKIEEQKKKEQINEEEIKRLEQEKSSKMTELEVANEDLRRLRKRVDEAKEREKRMQETMQKEEHSKKRLQQEVSDSESRVTELQADLLRKQTEASGLQTALGQEETRSRNLRSRANNLESEQEQFRSRIHRLEEENKVLEEKSKRSKWFL